MFRPKLECPYPWMHQTITTDDKTKPCCHAVWKDDPVWKNLPMEAGLKNDLYDLLRDDFVRGQWPKICGTCKRKEQLGIPSARQSAIRNFSDFDYDEIGVKFLDVKFTNTCNLVCRMCLPGSSSLVAEYNEKYGAPHFAKNVGEESVKDADHKVKYVKQCIENGLEMLKVTGGEPFACKYFKEVLNWTIENDYAKNLTIKFVTNATKISDSWIEKLLKFKKIFIIISAESTEDVYNYIRHKSSWKQFSNTCKKLANTFDNNKEKFYQISINCVLQNYNLFSLMPVYEFCQKHNFVFNLEPELRPINSELSVQFLPDEIKQKAIDLYTKNNAPFRDIIIKKLKSDSYNEYKCMQYYETTKHFDDTRNENYRNALHPIMIQYLDSLGEKQCGIIVKSNG